MMPDKMLFLEQQMQRKVEFLKRGTQEEKNRALLLAIYRGKSEDIEIAMKAGANTSLMTFICRYGQNSMGFSISRSLGRNAYGVAKKLGFEEAITIMRRIEGERSDRSHYLREIRTKYEMEKPHLLAIKDKRKRKAVAAIIKGRGLDVIKDFEIKEDDCGSYNDNKGRTPLHFAAKYGAPRVYEYLVAEGGYSSDQLDQYNNTPAQYKQERERPRAQAGAASARS